MPPQISYTSSNFPYASEASTPFPNEVNYKIEEVVKIVVNYKIEEEVIGHFGGFLAFFVQVLVDFFKRALAFRTLWWISSSGLYVLRTFSQISFVGFLLPFLRSIFAPFLANSLRAICLFYGTFSISMVVLDPLLDLFCTVHFIMIFTFVGLQVMWSP
jgi:hypothetical protein